MSAASTLRSAVVLLCLTSLALAVPALPSGSPASSVRRLEEEPLPAADRAELVVEARDGKDDQPLPVRVIVTGSDGKHVDGSGNGLYADGRFFADGKFIVAPPAGKAKVTLRSGPDYVPLEFTADITLGKRQRYEARLVRWFSPAARGWYSGDNHVHAQHDAQAVVKTSLAYTALQARANGLNFITEAGSHLTYENKDKLDTPGFLFRHAQEQRPGPFVGHLNTPGIKDAIPPERLATALKRPLPAQGLVELVHQLGGAVIHTHPLTPPHQLHWMGAGEVWSDAVRRRCADALDVDSAQSEQLWFSILNLGNRMAVSSYTDCALGRTTTLAPGDRRVYVQAKTLDDAAIVAGLRAGKTFATNGGPVFPFFTLDGQGPGSEVPKAAKNRIEVEVHSLYPLRRVQLIRRGSLVHAFDLAGKHGEQRVVELFEPKATDGPDWYVLRAEDEQGNWAITSPVYVGKPEREPAAASAIVLGIGNYTRFIQLRRDFFAHLLVTVSPGDAIKEVALLRDGKAVQTFKPAMGNQIADQKVPVTEIDGTFVPGWVWHTEREQAVHLQADWAVKESGWYAVQVQTAQQGELRSDAIHFDAQQPNSHAVAVARLRGAGTALDWWGYGEEMPLADIAVPFAGDHWWYPKQTFWRLRSAFDQPAQELGGGNKDHAKKFRQQQ